MSEAYHGEVKSPYCRLRTLWRVVEAATLRVFTWLWLRNSNSKRMVGVLEREGEEARPWMTYALSQKILIFSEGTGGGMVVVGVRHIFMRENVLIIL